MCCSLLYLSCPINQEVGHQREQTSCGMDVCEDDVPASYSLLHQAVKEKGAVNSQGNLENAFVPAKHIQVHIYFKKKDIHTHTHTPSPHYFCPQNQNNF